MEFFMKRSILLYLLVVLVAMPVATFAQGVTTGAMNGFVNDKEGKPVPGSRVTATHLPSGSKYGSVVRANGQFNIPSVRVGGPYTVAVSALGFKAQEKTGLTIELGQNLRIDFVAVPEAVQLEAVQITAERSGVLNSGRTGAAQNVGKEQIERFPTISRNFQDFTKFTPQINGNSVAGRNGRFNNIQIDGAQYNDLFGLGASGQPGGQANSNPISLDAIEQFQVLVAPYDVRQGRFSGGGINAVTRSGTNKWEGSAFFFTRSQAFVGDLNETRYLPTSTVGEYRDSTVLRKLDNFNEFQTGFRLGGPIIENKLFFFVNGEVTRRVQPFAQLALTQRDPAQVQLLTDAARQVDQRLRTFGYDPGTLNPYDAVRPGLRLFGRLDWNISDQHKLTLRHNFVDASDDIVTSGFGTVAFSNRNYRFLTNQNSTVVQLNSIFGGGDDGPQMSNEAIIGYTRIRDKRPYIGASFPTVAISGVVPGVTIAAGPENFSVANELDQDIFEITDNFTVFAGDHVITVGTQNEIVSFRNLFIRNLFGNYSFNSLADFLSNRSSRLEFDFARQGFDPLFAARFTAAQLSFYAQDEWTVSPQFKVTAGLRVDVPIFPNNPAYNITADTIRFNAGTARAGQPFGIRTDRMPSATPLFAPRVGFNWDVNGDRSTQIRGGVGLFTGRIPFVWISNQYSNTGVEFARVVFTPRSPDTLAFNPTLNPFEPAFARSIGNVTELNVISADFKMPQLLRVNAALDQQLPFGIVATLEGIYSQSLNEIFYSNPNIGPTGQQWGSGLPGFDGRRLYGTLSTALGSQRNATPSAQVGNFNTGPFNNVILLSNTSLGYSYMLTAQLQRQFENGLYANLAYTYGRSYDQNSGTSSQAVSQWGFNYTPDDPNSAPLSPSSFDRPHRVIGALSYRFEWLELFATTVSLFYEGTSGRTFSYIYDGDVNADGRGNNDLAYVPRDRNDIALVAVSGSGTTTRIVRASDAVYDQLNAFIQRDDYLRTVRGRTTERNGAREPWVNQLDVRFMQEIKLPVGRLEVTLDCENFLNLLNNTWGRVEQVSFSYSLLRFEGAANAMQAPTLGVPTGTPMFSYSDRRLPTNFADFNSRWRLQLGVRYVF
jgi:outer membrane receptor protein involved in Fe transport